MYASEETHDPLPGLPLDVVQIVLGYVQDTKSIAAARQVCRAWHQASAAAPATIHIALPGNIAEMRSKLALVLQVMPGLAGCHASVGAGAASAYPAECFRQLLSFPGLKALELRFSDSQELSSQDITQLGCLTSLTRLHLSNVSLPAASDSSPLLLLKQLQELSLVHHSKVSALMVGDGHLRVLGGLHSLHDLVLQGRMCSASDEGLLVLTGLTNLASLAISWVPWQSQITQGAALQLLSSLRQLKSLHLGGAELLLPSVPHYPVAAVHAPPAPPAVPAAAAAAAAGVAGLELPHAALLPLPLPQHSLPVAATSPESRTAAAAAAAASQTEVMRRMLAAKAAELDSFKLQFNCCGTGVEKALLSLGDIRCKLTGLQWSYAKLSGPSSLGLLGSCISLKSLKLRLWYQDYNLAPFEFRLSHLSSLNNLRTLVIDKRPPFQQQLPAQQAAITIPVTQPVLTHLAKCWTQLQKLQLGLSRADFGPKPLQGLAGFSQLRSLSVHCYDQGFDDGHFMLPIDVCCLPSSLVKLDLMHAELFSSTSSCCHSAASSSSSKGSQQTTDACRARPKHSCSSSTSCRMASSVSTTTSLRSVSSISVGALTSQSSSHSSRGGNSFVSRGCSSSAASSNGLGRSISAIANTGTASRLAGRGGFASTSAAAFTSMLSESFSLLSRQASLDVSAAAYLDQAFGQQQQQQQQGHEHELAQEQAAACLRLPSQGLPRSSGTGVSAFASAGAAAAAAAAVAAEGGRSNSSSGSSSSLSAMGSWSHAGAAPTPAAGPSVDDDGEDDLGTGWLRSLSSPDQGMQPCRIEADTASSNSSAAAAAAAATMSNGSTVARVSRQQSLPPLPTRGSVPKGSKAGRDTPSIQQQQAGVLAAAATAAAGNQVPRESTAGRRSNPFAAVSAAAAVAEAIGGCAAAAGCQQEEEKAASLAALLPNTGMATSCQGKHDSDVGQVYNQSTGKCPNSSSLARSYSTRPCSSNGAASSSSGEADDQDAMAEPGRAYLPLLQQMQLKHCSLEGVCLDDIITKPIELRCLQLVEVIGLAPRDVALLPFLSNLHRLTLIAARDDSWLGLAPLRLFAKLPELRHLDWVISEKAVSSRSRCLDLQALVSYPKLQVLTLHTVMGRYEQLHAVSGQLRAGCHVRLMSPAFCEHASKKSGFGISRLLGVASCLLPGTVPVL